MGRTAILIGALLATTATPAGQTYRAARHGGNYMHNFYLPPAPAATPWAPAWSPDGRWLAVAMSGSIWRIDPTDGSAMELTSNERYHSSPSWSPDGRWILYTADDGGSTIDLEVLEVASGTTRRLTDGPHLYLEPRFSPDGTRVAYVSTEPSGHFNVFVRPFDEGVWDGEPEAITADNNFGRDRLYFGRWDMHINPAWLPGGNELLLVSNHGSPLGSGHVWRVPAIKGGFADGRTVHREQTLYRTSPDVSIDGKRFVYSSTSGTADQFNNLYVLPTAGGEPYKLTFFEHDAFSPRFSPDGEWIAYIDNENGLPQLALLQTYGGRRRIVAVSQRRWKRPTGKLLVEVTDETGRRTPARIHLTAGDGRSYSPPDFYARVSAAGDHVFHADGRFELELPAGPSKLSIVKGFEYVPVTRRADVRAGQTTRVSVRLERLTDMAAQGWYSGSTHVHMNYGGNLHNTLENLILMSRAEDQDIINEQIANKDNRVLDHQFFVPGGKPHPRSTADQLLVVGQEYRPPFWGHVFMLGLRDHLISPFVTGYEGTAIESLYPSNTDMQRLARAQGAVTGYVHAYGGNRDPLETGLGGARGLIVDAALGTTDAVEWSASGRAGFYPWYALLNNGLRITAVGGEDSISDLHRSKLIGSVRTYVHTGDQGLDMAAWYEGLRAGRAFVSTGPLVQLQAGGQMPGGTVRLAEPGKVSVEVAGESIVPIGRAFLVVNGQEVSEIPVEKTATRFRFETELAFERSGWIHLRVEGRREDRFPLDCSFPQAFTNPVWVEVSGRPVRSAAAADYALRWIEELRAQADEWFGWRSEAEKSHVFGQIDEAEMIYRQLRAEVEVEERP